MKKIIVLLAIAMLFVTAGCHNQNTKITEKDVKKAEEALFNADLTTNPEAVPNAIATFRKYAEENPDNANAPETCAIAC